MSALSPTLGQRWLASWVCSPMNVWHADAPIRSINAQTVRETVRVTTCATRLVLRFTNEHGTHPIDLDAVSVAPSRGAGLIDTANAHKVTFGGLAKARILPGAPLFSDPIDLKVSAFDHVSVSYFTSGFIALETHHFEGQQTCYLSEPGDFTMAETMAIEQITTSHYALSGIYACVPQETSAIVCFGDSITDGQCSTIDANRRWPDIFAERLHAAGISMAVLNHGIGGNRLINDCRGVKALQRFTRDVETLHGVSHLIMLIGINDILWPYTALASGREYVDPDDIIAALCQLITRAKLMGHLVMLGTLLPFGNALPELPGTAYYTPEKESMRLAVNAFIRERSGAAAVIDFDALMRDPDHPDRLLPAYDSGDHIHPNDDGYRAMGNAIDLAFFA